MPRAERSQSRRTKPTRRTKPIVMSEAPAAWPRGAAPGIARGSEPSHPAVPRTNPAAPNEANGPFPERTQAAPNEAIGKLGNSPNEPSDHE